MGNRARVGPIAIVIAGAIALFCASDVRGVRAEGATLTVGGVVRTYVLHVPAKLAARVPLVLAFHGHGGTGEGMERLSGFDALADRDGFIVAYPSGVDRGWTDDRFTAPGMPDDLAFTAALLDSLEARYPIDRSRVYAAGMSNGAIFAESLACKLGDRFAAVAAVAGALPVPDRAGCPASQPVSVVQINGTLDPVLPFAGGPIGTFGTRGSVLSVPDTIAFWAAHDACASAPNVSLLAIREPSDGTSVRREEHAGCRDGTSVLAYSVIGAGHVWPGGTQYLPPSFIGRGTDQFDATSAIVSFFMEHSRPAPSR
jgi:polyhydroxybutyrate depolymerase